MRALIGIMLIAALAGSAVEAQTAGNAASPQDRAVLHDASGREMGWARLLPAGQDVRLRLEAKNLSPGMHGVHIHAVGRCDAPDFASAGAHWNPGGRKHGKNNSAGMHMGDLPNLIVDSKGRGTLIATLRGTSLSAILDADGASVIVHAAADDYQTDPSGNSGARIACGILKAS